MNIKILVFLCMFLPSLLLANENIITDIIPRSINFIIFLAIVYYLLAEKLKVFFSDRTKSIQAELDKVQEALKESIKKNDDAKLELENSSKFAEQLIKDAKEDAKTIAKELEQSYEEDIKNLSKKFDNKLISEEKKSKNILINDILEELFNGKNFSLSKDDLSNIILKKVS